MNLFNLGVRVIDNEEPRPCSRFTAGEVKRSEGFSRVLPNIAPRTVAVNFTYGRWNKFLSFDTYPVGFPYAILITLSNWRCSL